MLSPSVYTLQTKVICLKLATCLRMKPPKSKPMAPLSVKDERNQVLGELDHLLGNHQPDKLQANIDFNRTELLLMRICSLMETRLRVAAEEREKADEDEETKNDWMLAAAVIDRILFLIFNSLFIGGTFVFFVAFAL